MMRYLKLTNFELSRFFKIYLVLIGVTFVMQLLGVVFTSNKYLSAIKELLESGMTQEEALKQWGPFSFYNVTSSFWFFAPVALCAASLLIYVLFIWYRDWFGKNTFAYRLLMLPTARINVYFAKATAIFLMVLGLISLQIAFLPIESHLLQSIVPAPYLEEQGINQMISSFDSLRILYPTTFIEYLTHYGVGLMAVLVVFTGVLFERCFRWKGILLGVLFAGISLIVFFLPVIIQEFVLVQFFYPTELFFLMVLTGLIVMTGSILMSNYLLNKKIRV
ncbi:hypothetical protein [Ornithinibacillus bavariensis]|uniref:hypothetical protein n=1 Tax=Ornithinibacillus bavariensis TaxID=545502 RepID=UPI000EE91092|nr:hypothetical protein [Ornithinibacillus sp.]